jgi:cytochrome P450
MSATHSQPLEVPNVGALTLFKMMPEFRRDALKTFTKLAERHGEIVRFSGLWTSFMLTNPSHIEHVLQTNSRNYRKGRIYKELRPSTGDGLFVSDGEVWRRQRRLAQPAFHRQRIASFAKIMTDSVEEMLGRWRLCAEKGSPVEVDVEMLRLTLGIVGKALFSRDLSYGADAVSRSFDVIREYTMRRLTSIVKLPLRFPSPRNRRFQKAVANADRLVYDLIAERRRGGGNADDLLSLLMAARDEETGETLSDQELRDQTLTLIGAGYETTTQALCWAWYLLAKHPHVEERLRAELASVLGGRTPAFDDLPQLQYTLMVFQEAMRLYPPAWMLSRTAVGDDEIGGHRIPANAEILLLLYVTHRHPQYWGNPDAFDPENFSPEKTAARPPYAYFPFGGGPRQCIGNNFALMEAQLIIATIAQKYRLRLATEEAVEAEPSVTLRPRGGLKMTLHAIT